jgi:imidazolonepropionase-like amidohydrolase
MSGYLITNARILDGTGAAPFSGSIRVEDDRITEMTSGGTAPPARDAAVIDAAGATLMPGLVESSTATRSRTSRSCKTAARYG